MVNTGAFEREGWASMTVVATSMLTQIEATRLIVIEKKCVEKTAFAFPTNGGKLRVPLLSFDGAHQFVLDMTRGRIRLEQATFQKRVYSTTILLRLDIAGPPHTNPDGNEIACPHLHIYRKG